MTAAKQDEGLLNQSENPKARKELEDVIAGLKAGAEIQSTLEQEAHAKLTESEEQLRIEQAKLSGLQDQLDRLEKTLENFNGAR